MPILDRGHSSEWWLLLMIQRFQLHHSWETIATATEDSSMSFHHSGRSRSSTRCALVTRSLAMDGFGFGFGGVRVSAAWIGMGRTLGLRGPLRLLLMLLLLMMATLAANQMDAVISTSISISMSMSRRRWANWTMTMTMRQTWSGVMIVRSDQRDSSSSSCAIELYFDATRAESLSLSASVVTSERAFDHLSKWMMIY